MTKKICLIEVIRITASFFLLIYVLSDIFCCDSLSAVFLRIFGVFLLQVVACFIVWYVVFSDISVVDALKVACVRNAVDTVSF